MPGSSVPERGLLRTLEDAVVLQHLQTKDDMTSELNYATK